MQKQHILFFLVSVILCSCNMSKHYSRMRLNEGTVVEIPTEEKITPNTTKISTTNLPFDSSNINHPLAIKEICKAYSLPRLTKHIELKQILATKLFTSSSAIKTVKKFNKTIRYNGDSGKGFGYWFIVSICLLCILLILIIAAFVIATGQAFAIILILIPLLVLIIFLLILNHLYL